jgi:hypothetical protein
VGDAAWDVLHMRKAGNHTPNGVFKVNFIKSVQLQGIDVVLFYEDWSESRDFIVQKTNVPVLGINAFYPEDIADLNAAREARKVGGNL